MAFVENYQLFLNHKSLTIKSLSVLLKMTRAYILRVFKMKDTLR